MTASKQTKEGSDLVLKRTSKIDVPARVVIRGRVFVVLWEAVKIACVDCRRDLVDRKESLGKAQRSSSLMKI